MNYMGGKHRQGPKISEYVKRVLSLRPDSWYVEPFCGAMGVAYRVSHNKMILSDISQPLMTMWSEFQKTPDLMLPDVITEEDYQAVKRIKNPDDWRTAYYGFGMSFGSKYFGGYARDGVGTNYATSLKRSTLLKRSILFSNDKSVNLLCCSVFDLPIPNKSVVYMDPPYISRTKCHDSPDFDHDRF